MGKSRFGAISKDKREVDIYWKNISYRSVEESRVL